MQEFCLSVLNWCETFGSMNASMRTMERALEMLTSKQELKCWILECVVAVHLTSLGNWNVFADMVTLQ